MDQRSFQIEEFCGLHPLSSAQRDAWLRHVLKAGHSPSNIGSYTEISGFMDPDMFERAWNLVGKKHDVLRTRFVEGSRDDSLPRQLFRDDISVQVPMLDVSDQPDPLACAVEFRKQQFARPFSLYGGDHLFRCFLVKIERDLFHAVSVFHNLIADSASIALIGESLADVYSKLAMSEAPDLSARRYSDFISDEQRYRRSGQFQQHRAYWLEKFESAPRNRFSSRRRDRTLGAGEQVWSVPPALYDRMRNFIETSRSTMSELIVAVLYVYFSRTLPRRDLAIGLAASDHAGGPSRATAGLISATGAALINASWDLCFCDLISKVAEILRSDGGSRRFPMREIGRELRTRGLDFSGMFDLIFSYECCRNLKFANARGRQCPVSSGVEPAPLAVSFRDHIEGASIHVSFSLAHFEACEVAAIWERLIGILSFVVENRFAPIGAIPLSTVSERRLLLEQWNATAAANPRENCIHELFEAQVERTPDAVAVVHGDRELSYGELNARANRLAHHLRRLGVGPDDRVAICVERSAEMVVALLAVLKAGGAYVPLDPSCRREWLGYLLSDSTPVAALTQPGLRGALGDGVARIPVLELDGDASLWGAEPDTNPDPAAVGLRSSHLACVIHTSGWIGAPEGVMVAHGNVSRLFSATQGSLQFGESDVWPLLHSVASDCSVWEIWGALAHGGRLVVVPETTRRSPEEFYEWLCRAGVTILNQAPSAFRQLIAAQGDSGEEHQLRQVIFGGEELDIDMLKPWHWDGRNRQTRLINTYGITEATVHATYCQLAAGDKPRPGSSVIGNRIPDLKVYLLDGYGEAVPVGVSGEIHIGGAGLARGYLNRAGLTAERFVASPFVAGDRLYRTGDLARYLADGTLAYLGRNDHQVKIAGFRVALGEIEARLAAYPGIREAVVAVREDDPGEKRLIGYYTPVADGARVDEDDLHDHLSSVLPKHMVPAAYLRLEALPLMPNGKLDRQTLPAPDARLTGGTYVAPRTAVEEAFVRAWCQVLKRDRIGIEDNFFELGGDSLDAVKLASLLSRNGFDIAVPDLIDHPTIVSMMKRDAQRRAKTKRADAIPIRTGGTEFPLFLVHEIHGVDYYFAGLCPHIDSDIPVYGLSAIPANLPQLHTIEGIAARLVAMIRSIQPVGPYRLAGWSFGGIVAYEIAAQLIGQDEQVEFVGLIDTYVPAYARETGGGRHDRSPEHLSDPGNERWLEDPSVLLTTSFDAASLRRIIEILQQKEDDVGFHGFVAKCREAQLIPWFLWQSSNVEIQQHIARLAAHFEALENYAIPPISAAIHLFSAEEKSAVHNGMQTVPNPVLGWDCVMPRDRIQLVCVPGDHQSMMGEHIGALGQAVTEAIRRPPRLQARVAETYCRPLSKPHARSQDSLLLFSIPGAGDDVERFHELAGVLKGECSIYGLQPRGVDGLEVPHATVEATAAAYLKEIDAIHPDGPVHLLGHAFGGLAAFEIAIRLKSNGRQMASLTLIDSQAPDGNDVVSNEYTSTQVISEFIGRSELSAGRSLGLERERLEAGEVGGKMQLLYEATVRAGLRPKGSNPQALYGAVRAFGTAMRTSYRPQRPYSGSVRLLLAADPRLDGSNNQRRHLDMLAGWVRSAPDATFWRCAVDQFSVLKAPHARVLADWWRDGL